MVDGVLVQYTGEAYQHTSGNGGDIKEKERTTLHCTAPHCIRLHINAFYGTIFLCSALHGTVLHCTTLNSTSLQCTNTLHCTALILASEAVNML